MTHKYVVCGPDLDSHTRVPFLPQFQLSHIEKLRGSNLHVQTTMPHYIQNTSLTSLSIGDKIFAYAQGYHGQLIEAQGRLQDSAKAKRVFYANGQTSIGLTTRWRDKELQDGAPKMFTPLAAASLGETRVSACPVAELAHAAHDT